MAGDWIKVEKATLEKPEVLAISQTLDIHPTHAFGLCVRFWMWCDDQLSNGNARGVTRVTLDYVIGQTGMTEALIKVGWLRDRSGSLEVPHFDRHLSESAKNRALTKERVKRSKKKGNANAVTRVTQTPLPEKRREEKSTLEAKASMTGLPDAVEILDYLNEQAGKNFTPLSAHLDLIKARLKDPLVTKEGIKQMIRAKCREWRSNADMAQYLRPATLFNRSKFANYYDQRNQPTPNQGTTDADHANGF